jgi:hypothetical protein
VKQRYCLRKATSCKVTLSSGTRVGEGSVVDLTVPGCLIETGLALEPGQSVQLRGTLTPNAPCVSIWAWCGGRKTTKSGLSLFA